MKCEDCVIICCQNLRDVMGSCRENRNVRTFWGMIDDDVVDDDDERTREEGECVLNDGEVHARSRRPNDFGRTIFVF